MYYLGVEFFFIFGKKGQPDQSLLRRLEQAKRRRHDSFNQEPNLRPLITKQITWRKNKNMRKLFLLIASSTLMLAAYNIWTVQCQLAQTRCKSTYCGLYFYSCMEQGSWDDYACTNSVTDHVLIANKCITGNNLMPTYMSYQFSTD